MKNRKQKQVVIKGVVVLMLSLSVLFIDLFVGKSAHALFHSCIPSNARSTDSLVIVRCPDTAPDGASSFLLDSKAYPAFADQALSTALTAIVTGRNLSIEYTSDSIPGGVACSPNDCVRMISIAIY